MSTREHHEVFGVGEHVRGHFEPRKIRDQDELGIFVDLDMDLSNQPWRSSWHWHLVKVNFIQRLWAFSFSAVGKNNFKLEWCRRRWISSLPYIYFNKLFQPTTALKTGHTRNMFRVHFWNNFLGSRLTQLIIEFKRIENCFFRMWFDWVESHHWFEWILQIYTVWCSIPNWNRIQITIFRMHF